MASAPHTAHGVTDRWEGVVGIRTEAPELVSLARIRPGDAVLDVASATSETAVAAAQQAGPEGRVLVVEAASPDTGSASIGVGQRVTQMGFGNVEFVKSPVPRLELPADGFTAAVTSLGLAFSADPEIFLGSVHDHLEAGGRCAASVWSTPARVPLVSVALGALGSPVGADALFTLSEPPELTAVFEAAGFHDVQVVTTSVVAEFATPEAYADFALEGIEPVAGSVERSADGVDAAAHSAVADAAAAHCTDGDVIRFENEMLLAVGIAGDVRRSE